jgi:non-specific serine/threonine protein kinase
MLPLACELWRAAAFGAESLAVSRAGGHPEYAAARALGELGHLALTEGAPGRAAARFAEGLRLACRYGPEWSPIPGQCLAGAAAVIEARGQPERAARLFAAVEAPIQTAAAAALGPAHDRSDFDRGAAAVRRRLGAAASAAAWEAGRALSVEEAVAEALRGLTPPPGAPATDTTETAAPRPLAAGTGPVPPGRRGGPLTAREREAAALVAQGLTNRRIAARLAVSERTVDAHVARILAKLGAPARAQVAGRLDDAAT